MDTPPSPQTPPVEELINGRINALPTELFINIFLLCTSSQEFELNVLDRAQAPTSLTQVCNRWRTIALGQGELWNWINISLVNGKQFIPNIRAEDAMCRRSLERVGSTPINLRLDGGIRDHTYYNHEMGEALAREISLIGSATYPRIKTLYLQNIPASAIALVPAGLFPDIETLGWMQCPWIHERTLRLGELKTPIIAFRDCAALRRVVTWGGSGDDGICFPEPFQAILPWSQITSVVETLPTLISRNLSSLKALCSADINLEAPISTWDALAIAAQREQGAANQSECVTLSAVRSLAVKTTFLSSGYQNLTVGGMATISAVIGVRRLRFRADFLAIDVPNLKSFWLEHYGEEHSIHVLDPSTHKWMLNNLKGVKVLGLHLCRISRSALSDLFAAAPKTTTLVLYVDSVRAKNEAPITFGPSERIPLAFQCRSILSGLASPGSHPLPLLQVLVVDFRGMINSSIKERTRSVSELAKVLDHRTRRTDIYPARLRKLVLLAGSQRDVNDVLSIIQEFVDAHGLVFESYVDAWNGDNRTSKDVWMSYDPEREG
ncbi:hypothetical protein DFP72DRAFT_1099867 [Ephemerocybe angulata]|uniref:F-box domain-containing protein n=1 Tax=Ephemerocybe angulata TaxID=980116 RepID=A0A8H6LUR5_9AGAR|nr:hypothetical protein DFP72DRAFT_1099867 [Tulosesus angulatus]